MGEALLTYRGTVYPWQCDHMGHMNVMWYVGKFDEATWALAALAGITPAYLRASGCGMAAVQQNITYKRELLAGDVVAVRTRLLEARDKVVRFVHVMTDATIGDEAAVCELTGVHIDRAAHKAVPFPAAIAAALRAMIAAPGAP
jgi:acyl-CoA thioester hydrolase